MDWSILIGVLIVCIVIWFVGASICKTIYDYLGRVINKLKIKKYD